VAHGHPFPPGGRCGNRMKSKCWPVRRDREGRSAIRCREGGRAINADVKCSYPCAPGGGLYEKRLNNWLGPFKSCRSKRRLFFMRSQIFISYSHKDKKWLDSMQTMLKPLVREQKISVWDDKKIEAGQKWREEIGAALSVAKVAVLLISPDFLASDYIAHHELPRLLDAARQEGLTIIWVAVRHSLYKDTEIEQYQAANDPQKPLAHLRPAERERTLVEICECIKRAAIGATPENRHHKESESCSPLQSKFEVQLDQVPEIKSSERSQRQINATGLDIIKNFEGFLSDAYLDFMGNITVGYGTRKGVKLGMKVNQEQAEILLKEDLCSSEIAVSHSVKVPLSDNQFSALVSLVHNIGQEAFINSTLLRLLNQGDYEGAANQFLRWDRLGAKKYPALSRRREAERALFLSLDEE
jgi:GH24 family phage-related lysozyme (muramidase)